jgi:two-component system, OmpR family, alkaline phosphatase synthesis response regulator PhoP
MPEILVIDDEANILELIKLYLEGEGFRVQTAGSGEEALGKMGSIHPDLIILDIMMPGINGFEVCQHIRKSSNVPIIMLTARKEDTDKIVGLEIGADDYLTKPFNPRELVARVKAVIRRTRMGLQPSDVITLGKLQIQIPKQEVTVNGQPVRLRTKEFALLSVLAQNKDVVFSREKLLEKVWGFDYYGETRTVDVHVNHLREKITASGVNIETVRGAGYKLTVEEAEAST